MGLVPIVGCGLIQCATCSTLERAGSCIFGLPPPGPMSAQDDSNWAIRASNSRSVVFAVSNRRLAEFTVDQLVIQPSLQSSTLVEACSVCPNAWLPEWLHQGRSVKLLAAIASSIIQTERFAVSAVGRGRKLSPQCLRIPVFFARRAWRSKDAQVVSDLASRLVRSTPAAPNLESPETLVDVADIRLCFIMSPAHSKTTFPSRRPISCSKL